MCFLNSWFVLVCAFKPHDPGGVDWKRRHPNDLFALWDNPFFWTLFLPQGIPMLWCLGFTLFDNWAQKLLAYVLEKQYLFPVNQTCSCSVSVSISVSRSLCLRLCLPLPLSPSVSRSLCPSLAVSRSLSVIGLLVSFNLSPCTCRCYLSVCKQGQP